MSKRLISSVSLLLLFASVVPAQIDVKIPEGFSIKKVAGDEIATNIFCMALNTKGQPVVSGPGYIKTLIDEDGDGIYEDAVMFINRPRTGAQGMLFVDDSLYCTGDEGLLRFKDDDKDDVADAEPELVFPMTTGAEHTAHAIRIGPGGWLYVIAGNQTKILPEYVASLNSPVKKPAAGFVMRFDSKNPRICEVVAHGFRNAYDFDFNSAGSMFVYDSDGERDISLPWYRPTRLFQVRAGDYAGWISTSWKRPSSYFDMPTTVGELGRGSPSGVCCYKQAGFANEFQDAIFVGDWTFGQIAVFKRDRVTGKYDQGAPFLIPQGQFGFAITDLVVAIDGSLLVSVGGRGTEGGVYRISYQPKPDEDGLRWAKSATDLQSLKLLRTNGSWTNESASMVVDSVNSESREIRRLGLEMVVGRKAFYKELDEESTVRFFKGLVASVENVEDVEDSLASRIMKAWPSEFAQEFDTWLHQPEHNPSPKTRLLFQLARVSEPSDRAQVLVHTISLLQTAFQADRLIRLTQLVMSGCNGGKETPQVFHGYTAKEAVLLDSAQSKNVATFLKQAYEKFRDHPDTSHELLRLMAMLGEHFQYETKFEKPATLTVVDEIHWLICAAQMKARFPREKIVESLLSLNARVAAEKRNTDRNWKPRLEEMAVRLVQNYRLSSDLVANTNYGKPGHTFLHAAISDDMKLKSIERFESFVSNSPDEATLDQLLVVLEKPLNRELMRTLNSKPRLYEQSLIALAESPDVAEAELYRNGLNSLNRTTIKRCATALRKVETRANQSTQILAYLSASRLGWDYLDATIRDELLLLLQEQLGRKFTYEFKAADKVQSTSLDEVRDVLTKLYPDDERLVAKDEIDIEQLMSSVDWESGDLARGAVAFEKFQCARCHDTGNQLGPRLQGITKRFSRNDTIRAIVYPNEQVSDRYKSLMIETIDGLICRGVVIYESADGITLLDDSGKTVRINRDDIESRVNSTRSLMPEGLMNEATPQEFADLFRYLQDQ